MFCLKSCGVALIFLVANLYLTFNTNKYEITKKYEETLSNTQLHRYKNIVEERKNISLKGYMLGLFFSFVVLMLKYLKIDVVDKSIGKIGIVCLTGAITFVTQYLFYILSPKSDWMVLHLDTKEQREQWLKIYRTMQYNYHLGLALGVAAVMIFSYSMCK